MEQERKCVISAIKQQFNLEQICGDEYSLERWVIVPDINRPGLELAGFFDYTEPHRIVVLGLKEMTYIKQLDENILRQRFEQITDGWTPAIVIANGLECPPILKEVANQKNFPVFVSQHTTSNVMIELTTFLDEKLSPVEYVHGVLVNVYGKGVLLTGESGMGKSEIALELIRKGHILIADDRVDITLAHGQLYGSAPELLKGMLEIRGIGIMNVSMMFGASSIMSRSMIDFVIHLEMWDDNKDYLRVGIEESENFVCHGIEVPRLVFPVRESRNLAMLVESAVIDFTLKRRGFNSSTDFEKRVYDEIKRNKENR